MSNLASRYGANTILTIEGKTTLMSESIIRHCAIYNIHLTCEMFNTANISLRGEKERCCDWHGRAIEALRVSHSVTRVNVAIPLYNNFCFEHCGDGSGL